MVLSKEDLKRQKKKERAEQRRREEKTKARSKMIKKAILLSILAIIFGGAGYLVFYAATSSPGIGPLNSAHDHADWAIYINGSPIDVTLEKYKHKSDYVHMEGGPTIHMHAANAPIGYFLNSIGIEITPTSITTDGITYQNEGDKRLRLFVNGKENTEFDKYVLRSLDKILIVYGNESDAQLEQYIKAVPDEAKALDVGRPVGAGGG